MRARQIQVKKSDLRILAIVPAFNEMHSVGKVVREILELPLPINAVVVDDGSTDDTAKVARAVGAVVLRLPYNLGIGGAVQTGFLYAFRHGYDVAVQVDGDGQHVPQEIPRLLDTLEKQRVDMVIGSRFLGSKKHRPSWIRRIGIWIFTWVNSWVLRTRITDNTSGFRAFNRRTIQFLSENYPQDYPEPESVVLLGLHGFSIVEIPVEMRERAFGKSSISPLRAVYYMIKVLFSIFMDMFKEKI